MKTSKNEIAKQFILEQSFNKDKLDYKIAEYYSEVLRHLESMSRQCMWIFDYCQNNFYYLSKNTGFYRNDEYLKVSENGFDYFIRNTHPDDVLYVLSIQKTAWNFLKKLNRSDLLTDYKIVFTFRLQNALGHYVFVSQQVKVIATDEFNNIWLALGLIEEINSKLVFLPYIENTVDGKRIALDNLIKHKQDYAAPVLSNKEMDLLVYLAHNLKQIEIANRMNISVHTLKNHRKSLYRKLHATSKQEVIKNAYYLRIIDID